MKQQRLKLQDLELRIPAIDLIDAKKIIGGSYLDEINGGNALGEGYWGGGSFGMQYPDFRLEYENDQWDRTLDHWWDMVVEELNRLEQEERESMENDRDDEQYGREEDHGERDQDRDEWDQDRDRDEYDDQNREEDPNDRSDERDDQKDQNDKGKGNPGNLNEFPMKGEAVPDGYCGPGIISQLLNHMGVSKNASTVALEIARNGGNLTGFISSGNTSNVLSMYFDINRISDGESYGKAIQSGNPVVIGVNIGGGMGHYYISINFATMPDGIHHHVYNPSTGGMQEIVISSETNFFMYEIEDIK